ncbi:uncharacterized protein EI90DRAFT_3028344, partial [Cantharellus anzutake]|uniref:uncharacterized protein n=1 Tax=Cantharellus anzutake TaxID=1750568 RepID=UPI001903BD2D
MPPARTSHHSSTDEHSRVNATTRTKTKESSAPLQRGSAHSLTCRKRKLKCDASKPACNQCIRATHPQECSYDNGKALSRTQTLQRRITQLEEMLAQLQGKNMIGSPSSSASSNLGGILGADPGLGASSTPGRERIRARSISSTDSGMTPNHTDSLVLQSSPHSSRDSYNNHLFSDPPVDFPQLQGFVFGSDPLSIPSFGTRTVSPDPIPLNNAVSTRPPSAASSSFPLQYNSASTSTSLGVFDINPSAWSSSSASVGYSSQTPPYASPNLSTGYGLDDSLGGLRPIPMALSNDRGGWAQDSSVPSAVNGFGDLRVRASAGFDTDQPIITSTPEGQNYLLTLFLNYRRRCYFDVHPQRFLASLQDPDPQKRPHPCLMDAIYLLGCYLSRDDELKAHEVVLLSRARQGLCDSLEHSDRLWNFVQASCLIAFFLYQNGRFIEAYHQTCQVARFAVSCGLHQISSPHLNPSGDLVSAPGAGSGPSKNAHAAPWTVTNMSVRRAGSMLDPPKDQIEVGERILTFWHIFLLDRCGSIMTNLPAALPDECDSFSQIETVWPRTLEEYEHGQAYDADCGTVRQLYQPDTAPAVGRPDTIFTLRLKGSALFEQASRLGSRYASSMPETLRAKFYAVDYAIGRFLRTLPYVRNSGTMGEVPPTSADDPVNAQLVFVHTLALTAMIRLHNTAALEEPLSYDKRLKAAEAVVSVVSELANSEADFGEFDMLIGVRSTFILRKM